MELPSLPRRRWSDADFDRLIDAGIFGPEERVELVDGDLIIMTPQKGPHFTALSLTDRALRDAFGPSAYVRNQGPLQLGDDSRPEPDLAVVNGQPEDYWDAHPRTALLVVEVADTTLPYDRQVKGPIYAQAAIPEYWIVNLPDRLVEVYREPHGEPGGAAYRVILTVRPGDSIAPLHAPGRDIPVARLFRQA